MHQDHTDRGQSEAATLTSLSDVICDDVVQCRASPLRPIVLGSLMLCHFFFFFSPGLCVLRVVSSLCRVVWNSADVIFVSSAIF